MQTPNEKTPVTKCIDLSAYSAQMLGKFKEHPTLIALGLSMQAAGASLAQAQDAYAAAVRAILPARVDVTYENFMSDKLISRLQKKIEIADDTQNGPIAKVVLPGGSSVITRLRGASQVAEMINLEGRLAAAKGLWSEAEAEQGTVKEHRESYAAALKARTNRGQDAKDLRAVRDAEKLSFIKKYASVAHSVEAEFPRDTAMQNLFFDDVRSRSTAEQAEGDDDVPEPEAAAAPAAEDASGKPPST